MIGRTHRFHGHSALNGVYKRGKTVRVPMMSLRYLPRGPGRPYRVAVVISRKVSKSAVVRNRVRRRIYAAVRVSGTDIRPGTDLVFTVFDDHLAEMSADKLKEAVDGLLGKTA